MSVMSKRDKRKAAGLCVKCGKKSDHKSCCRECTQKAIPYGRKHYTPKTLWGLARRSHMGVNGPLKRLACPLEHVKEGDRVRSDFRRGGKVRTVLGVERHPNGDLKSILTQRVTAEGTVAIPRNTLNNWIVVS